MSELENSMNILSLLLDQPVTMLAVLGIGLAASLFYALKPEWFLKRKFIYEDIPPASIQTARILGTVLSVALGIGVVYYIYRLIAG